VSVFVGKIPRGTRVKELKEVIIAKGVKPINILWKGGKGYALIYCEKKEVPTSDELFEKLKNLTIGDNVLNVEPDKRIKPAASKDGETTTKITDDSNETTVDDSEAKNKNPASDVEPVKEVKPIVEPAKQVKPIVEPAKQVKPIVEPAKQVKPIVEPAKQVKPIIKDEQVKPIAEPAKQVKPFKDEQVKPIIKDEQVKPIAKVEVANGSGTTTDDVSSVKTPTSNES